ncbi:MAG: hypothetical protein ACK4ZN_12225, partial [Oceanibaculum sp.]
AMLGLMALTTPVALGQQSLGYQGGATSLGGGIGQPLNLLSPTFVAPPPRLCTDNAAMIAWAGIERLRLGLTDGLDFAPRPRWPLDPDAISKQPRATARPVKAAQHAAQSPALAARS